VNTATASFDDITGKKSESSQRNKLPDRKLQLTTPHKGDKQEINQKKLLPTSQALQQKIGSVFNRCVSAQKTYLAMAICFVRRDRQTFLPLCSLRK